jgi:hypothetical protein
MDLEIVSREKTLTEAEVAIVRDRIAQGLAYLGPRIISTQVKLSALPDGTGVSIVLHVRKSDRSTTVVRRVGKILFDTLDHAISRTQVCITRYSDRSLLWRGGSREAPQLLVRPRVSHRLNSKSHARHHEIVLSALRPAG